MEERWRRQVKRQWRRHRSESWDGFWWTFKYFMFNPSDRWYASLFPRVSNGVAEEITPNYCVLPESRIAEIAELIPDLKLIFIMRNPIERAWSHAQMQLVRMSKVAPTAAAFRAHLHSKCSRELSDYRQIIAVWTKWFSPQQILISYLEDVHFAPRRHMRSVYEFLGVDAEAAGHIVRRRVHVGGEETMPTDQAIELANIYLPTLTRLGELFGGHAARWLELAQELVENPPAEESIGYPLWESELWTRVWNDPLPPPFATGLASDLVAF